MQTKKRLLVIGITLRSYPRNRVLLDALAREFDLDEVLLPQGVRGQIVFVRTLLGRLKRSDGIFLIQPTMRFAMFAFLARCFTRKLIIGDAFISIYDTSVSDRALARGKSLKGLYYHALDMLYVRACDALLFDTLEHESYFMQTCRIPRRVKRFIFPICVDTEEIEKIQPSFPSGIQSAPDKKTVLFHGGYIPLQGIQYIIEAAALFQKRDDVRFIMVGSGQTRKAMEKKAADLHLANIQFVPWLEFHEMIATIKNADVSLGIFGDTEKAQRVIPNKILESMAAGVPVVCGRNIPMERHFKEGEQVFYARLADPVDIARAITEALSDAERAKRIAEKAKVTIEENFSLHSLAKKEVRSLLHWFNGDVNKSKTEDASRPRIAVYTAIFGAKDRLREPLSRPDNCDFICFTDQPLRSNTWQVRRITPPVPGDMTRSNRQVKFFPNKYLPDYDYSVYIDGNMRLLADLLPLIEAYLHDVNIAFFDHMGNVGDARNSIYAEADFLIRIAGGGKQKDDPLLIQKQVDAYRREGYPEHNGLITAMVIVRRHNSSDVVRAMELWWKELNTWSKRDQVSFNYVAWKTKLSYATIPGDSRKNPYFYRHAQLPVGIFGAFCARTNEVLFFFGLC